MATINNDNASDQVQHIPFHRYYESIADELDTVMRWWLSLPEHGRGMSLDLDVMTIAMRHIQNRLHGQNTALRASETVSQSAKEGK